MAEKHVDAEKIARETMPDMLENDISPTPENYAVWYHYMSGRNKELVDKINELKKSKGLFSPAIMRQLHDKYLSEQAKKAELQRQSYNAQSLIADVMGIINGLGGEANSYNKELDGYIEDLSGKYDGDASFEDMLKNLLERSITMRESGDGLQKKLEESKQEAEYLRVSLERITEEANRDSLTGLFNRKVFDRSIEEMSRIATEEGRTYSLLMLDIDHFKKFNDDYGHQIGDEVLRIVGRELMQALKGSDIVARYGGEEFAVLLPNTNLTGAMIVADNLRKSIASRELTRRGTDENYGALTVSVGAAQFRAGADSASSLIKRADKALYVSKEKGRNRVTPESHSKK